MDTLIINTFEIEKDQFGNTPVIEFWAGNEYLGRRSCNKDTRDEKVLAFVLRKAGFSGLNMSNKHDVNISTEDHWTCEL